MSEPYKGLNAALARNSGPSAEDVETLADVMRRADDEALVRTNFGQLVADYDETARAILTSDWLAAHTAAAEARGARRALTEIGERARAAQDEVQGADFGTVLVATVNAYSDACKDLLARFEGGA